MLLSIARIAPLKGRVDIAPEWMRSRLWHHRSMTDPVEHLRVCRGDECLRIAAFTVAMDQFESDDAIRKLINTTILSTPRLTRWRLL
ncbi:hypothetical protein [Actinoplanes sp. DH11]|uniref:hypothetical protein n=1 Tax=Actinoplanes sp. DH11 TaxID=2857011 RepID=UPI001E511127|nr:hypothetical protein [Actinoplanes sp. DH11]